MATNIGSLKGLQTVNQLFNDTDTVNDAFRKLSNQLEESLQSLVAGEINESTYRAAASTGTAVNASVSVDLVLAVALSDSANRALASARAAHNAAATDNICHWYCTSKCILQLSFYHKI